MMLIPITTGVEEPEPQLPRQSDMLIFFGREKVNTTLQIGGLGEMCRLVESELLRTLS
jgi:hypothetical protein